MLMVICLLNNLKWVPEHRTNSSNDLGSLHTDNPLNKSKERNQMLR